MNKKPLIITTWGAVLRLESKVIKCRPSVRKKFCTVSDPQAVDAGMDISTSEIVLIAHFKKLNNANNI